MRPKIKKELYSKIVELVPILTVDVIIHLNGGYLLVKRNNEPLKGQYWVVGGRVLKDESVWEAVNRKVMQEIGCTVTDAKMIGMYEDSYAKSAFGVPTHTTSIVFDVHIDHTTIKLDEQSSDWIVVNKLPDRFIHKLFICKNTNN